MTNEPNYIEHIQRALQNIEKWSIQRSSQDGAPFKWAHGLPSKIDWIEFHRKALNDLPVTHEVTLENVHDILDRALLRLRDGHSFMEHPDFMRWGDYDPDTTSYEKRLVDTAAQRTNYIVQKPNWHSLQMPSVETTKDGLVYVNVPSPYGLSPDEKTKFRYIIRDGLMKAAHEHEVASVIVDLRENSGGSILPMIWGLSPILGPGIIAHFKDPQVTTSCTIDFSSLERLDMKDHRNFPLIDIPVAVLAGPDTCSAGEFTFLSLRGRCDTIGTPNTRSFGASTHGLSSGNITIPVVDSLLMHLCYSIAQDRHGNGDGGPLPVDYPTANPRADATSWLKSMSKTHPRSQFRLPPPGAPSPS